MMMMMMMLMLLMLLLLLLMMMMMMLMMMLMIMMMTATTAASFISCQRLPPNRPTEGMTILTPTADEDAMMAALKEAAEATQT